MALLRHINAAQRQAIFIGGTTRQCHLSHRVNGGFKHGHSIAFGGWRNTKAVPLIAARRFGLERPSVLVRSAQGGIFWLSLLIFADKHTVVIGHALVQNALFNAVIDYGNRDAATQQILHNAVIVRCSGRQGKG